MRSRRHSLSEPRPAKHARLCAPMTSQLAQLTPAERARAEAVRRMREENARAIAASRKPNGTRAKYVEVDVAELQSTVIAMRGEIDALRGQVELLASQVVALTEDVLDTRAHTKNLPAVRAPQASGEAPWRRGGRGSIGATSATRRKLTADQ